MDESKLLLYFSLLLGMFIWAIIGVALAIRYKDFKMSLGKTILHLFLCGPVLWVVFLVHVIFSQGLKKLDKFFIGR